MSEFAHCRLDGSAEKSGEELLGESDGGEMMSAPRLSGVCCARVGAAAGAGIVALFRRRQVI